MCVLHMYARLCDTYLRILNTHQFQHLMCALRIGKDTFFEKRVCIEIDVGYPGFVSFFFPFFLSSREAARRTKQSFCNGRLASTSYSVLQGTSVAVCCIALS